MKHKRKAFSLIELLISLIIISLIISAFAPVLSKKIKTGEISLSQSQQITTECSNSPYYGEKCELCTKRLCIKCALENCGNDEYIDSKKCSCSSCKNWSDACLQCNSKGCLRCNNSPMRYVKNGKCELCPSGHYCDGAKDYATCPNENGYYCDSSGIHKCTGKYGTGCSKCNSLNCLECSSHYGKFGSNCKFCGANCIKCSTNGTCDICNDDWVYNSTTKQCVTVCPVVLPYCKTCTGSVRGADNSDRYTLRCTKCASSHYIDSSGNCAACTKSNCSQCADKTGGCILCKGGYYLQNGQCISCKEKFGVNCASCNSNECLSCNSGFHLKNKVCSEDDGNFSCSDSNFMQIGKLCVTRKNMGDSPVLYLPPDVIRANFNESCYANTQKCCWKGTIGGCQEGYSSYSACNRTICNWQAAESICSNFNYADKKWRLATKEEMKNWLVNSQGLDSNGLMLCETSDTPLTPGLAGCHDYGGACKGAGLNSCYPAAVWGQEAGSFSANLFVIGSGEQILGTNSKNHAYSVRCVSEME